MFKRAFTVFVLLSLAFSGLCLRTVNIGTNAAQAAGSSAGMSIDIASLRGTVYDCNLKPLTNGETDIYAAAKPTNRAIAMLKSALPSDVFESAKERMSKGRPVAVKTSSFFENTADIKSVFVPKRYYEDSLACHIIGYLDSEKNGISGIEMAYDQLLSEGHQAVSVRFSSSANGRVLLGEDITVAGCEIPKSGVVLTIDSGIQRIAEKALDASGAECAAAVVIDVESGAVRACVSRPLFNQNDVASSLNNDNSPLINRALLPFSVGSVFKPVVAASALENGISGGFEYNCTGSVTHNGVTFNCHKKSGHGVLDMQGAVAYSCNTYFIALALETGAYNIIKTAEKFGFGRETVLAYGIKSLSGNLPAAVELDSKAAVANISFGQGALTATPLQICAMMAAIARNGVYIRPYLIEGEVDGSGAFTKIKEYSEHRQIISEKTAKKLQKFLLKVVEDGSGTRAASSFVSVAGKTATAQTGKSINGEEIYNAWFAGYFPADNPKYAVAILKEDGGEGAISCAPVFRQIAEQVTENVLE